MPNIRRRGRPSEGKFGNDAPSIQALDRGIDVLEALAANDGLTLTALANHLSQSPATMHRVLGTLAQRNYVENDPERQEWFIGSGSFRLGSAFLRRTNIVERSRPVMRDLMTRTGETSNLGIERDGDVLFVSQVETHETIRAFFPPGTRSPLHASGIGKALLSSFDLDRFDAYLKRAELVSFTDKTIRNGQHLRDEIRLTRERGYSVDNEERTIGMRCVAAWIVNGYGEAVAGISVSGPTSRMPDTKVREIGHLVIQAAAAVSVNLGAE